MVRISVPHGGKLVNRIAGALEKEKLSEELKSVPCVGISLRNLYDLEMIATGAFSPLEGFMNSKDVESVAENKRTSSGVVWTIPVLLGSSKEEAEKLPEGEKVALKFQGDIVACLVLEEKFSLAREKIAEKVYGITDVQHPGVRAFYNLGDVFLAGKITLIESVVAREFREVCFDPQKSRDLFKQKGWKRVVGFQTRNPIHRAHEYILKCALEIVDGVFIHPLVGETKKDDVPASVRMQCYQAVVENYFPTNSVVVSVLPANMHYAGPREAVLHALVRKNYGCTHFVVGRDHAGVGNYYGTYDAHEIFDEFKEEELGITPLFFEHSFYCKTCEDMVSKKTCPHDDSHHVSLSGTKVRELLFRGLKPPMEFTRPEVAEILINQVYAELSKLVKQLEDIEDFNQGDLLGVRIAAYGKEGINALLKLAQSPKTQTRKAAIHGLWALGDASDARVLSSMKKALFDKSKEVRAC
ncbi:MAG: sulfate adenylyltransferase, partial [Candidatus Micrarchaeia archaeon]